MNHQFISSSIYIPYPIFHTPYSLTPHTSAGQQNRPPTLVSSNLDLGLGFNSVPPLPSLLVFWFATSSLTLQALPLQALHRPSFGLPFTLLLPLQALHITSFGLPFTLLSSLQALHITSFGLPFMLLLPFQAFIAALSSTLQALPLQALHRTSFGLPFTLLSPLQVLHITSFGLSFTLLLPFQAFVAASSSEVTVHARPLLHFPALAFRFKLDLRLHFFGVGFRFTSAFFTSLLWPISLGLPSFSLPSPLVPKCSLSFLLPCNLDLVGLPLLGV